MFQNTLKEVHVSAPLAATIDSNAYVAAMLASRRVALSMKSGEFIASGIVGVILGMIDTRKGYPELRASLVPMRNTLHFTAYAMKRLSEMTRQRGNDKPEIIANMVLAMLADFKKQNLDLESGIDREVVAELILAPFNGFDDFHLVTPAFGRSSYVERFADLYESAAQNQATRRAEYARPDKSKKGQGMPPPLDPIAPMLDAMPLSALARMRVLDWVFQMHDAPMFWSSLLPADRSGEAQQMSVRRAGVEQLAGIIHALIQAETVFCASAMQSSFNKLEGWLGKIPTTYTRGFDPYKEYVMPIDVLGLISDADAVINSVDGSGGPKGLSATVFFSDLSVLPSWKAFDAASKRSSSAASGVTNITDLQELLEPILSPLMAMPMIGEVSDMQRLDQYIKIGEDHHMMLTALASHLTYTSNTFLGKTTVANIKALGLRCAFKPSIAYPAFAQSAAVVVADATDAGISLPINAIQGTGTASQLITERHLMSFATMIRVTESYQYGFGVNRVIAKRLSDLMGGQQWTTLYPPAYAEPEARTHGIGRFNSGPDILDQLARMTGRPVPILLKDLAHWPFRQMIATAMSSWLQLLDLTSSSGRRTLPTGEPVGSTSVIEPLGRPFGLGIRDWNALFADGDVITLVAGSLGCRVIRNYAVPTTQMTGAMVQTEGFYHYFIGKVVEDCPDPELNYTTRRGITTKMDGTSTLEGIAAGGPQGLAYLAEGPLMLHMAAFPTPSSWSVVRSVFDTRYIYSADAIVGSMEVTGEVKTQARKTQAITSTEQPWQGTADAAFTKYHGEGGETTLGAPTAPRAPEQATKAKIIEHAAQLGKKARADRAAADSKPTEATVQAAKGGIQPITK
jgi:hypothetical protein